MNVVSTDIAEAGTPTFAVLPSEVVAVVLPPSDAVAVTFPVVVEGVVGVGVGAGAEDVPVPPVPLVHIVEGVIVTATLVVCEGITKLELPDPQFVPGSVMPDTVNLYLSALVIVTGSPLAFIVITVLVEFTTNVSTVEPVILRIVPGLSMLISTVVNVTFAAPKTISGNPAMRSDNATAEDRYCDNFFISSRVSILPAGSYDLFQTLIHADLN